MPRNAINWYFLEPFALQNIVLKKKTFAYNETRFGIFSKASAGIVDMLLFSKSVRKY